MFNVLLIDRSNSAFVDLAMHLAQIVSDPQIRILLLSDKEASGTKGNLEIVNVHDVPQSASIQGLQNKYGFSLHKALVPERAFFDYSSFRKSQCYSDLSLEQIYRIVTPYVNALDYLIRERVDLVIEGLADNFMTSAAGRIADHYGKKFYMTFMYYWWKNAVLFVDRIDQTSTVVDERYEYHLGRLTELNRAALKETFRQKAVNLNFSRGYTLASRIRQAWNRKSSYEPLSLTNWVLRRLFWLISKVKIRLFVQFEQQVTAEKFLLFPLHVTPEASLLGSVPELADQFALIKNLSMNLPVGTLLYVKEHPHQQVGLGLDYGFYRRVLSLPNVKLYGPGVSAETLYCDPKCLAVVVISGTLGLEAALRGVPVFVFGRPIYHRGDCFIKPQSFDEFFAHVKSLIESQYRFDEGALYALLQALQDGSCSADVDFTQAKSWLELADMVNVNTAGFIRQQYTHWQTSRSTSVALATATASGRRA
jgi:hypothetical protein